MAARAVTPGQLLWLWVLAACAGPRTLPVPPAPQPVAPQTYPLRVSRVDEAALAASEQAFRDATGIPWTDVQFDPYGGLLREASLVEPVPEAFPTTPTYDGAAIRPRWTAFLTEHAAALALDAPGMVPVPDRPNEIGFDQVWAGQVIGGAQVSWYDVGYSQQTWRAARLIVSGHGWPTLPHEPTVRGPDTLAMAWVGRPGTRVVRFTHVPQPCDPPGAGIENPCGGRPIPPLELRLVVTAHVRLAPAAVDAPWNGFAASVGFKPDEPLPQRIDAVTGELLDAGVCAP